jgi:dTMP kinase
MDVVLTREPGGTQLGEAIRELLLHGEHVAPWAEAALYAASRAQHVEELIRPALEGGATVVCDRYLDSSVVYQGTARGLGPERVLDLNLTVVGGLLPDITFLLSLSPAQARERMGRELDRIEKEGAGFMEAVAAAYGELAARFPDRYVIIDAARAPEAIAEEIHGSLRLRA